MTGKRTNRGFERVRRGTLQVVSLSLVIATQSVCSEEGPDDGPDLAETELPTTAQVSNLIEPPNVAGAALRMLDAEGDEKLVYVALPTGAAPNGFRAHIRRVGDEFPITTRVQDGGFDPIAIRAGSADSIEVVVTGVDGSVVLSIREAMRTKRPPTVVRTWPPRTKSDMPVNASMVVVFSEPLD